MRKIVATESDLYVVGEVADGAEAMQLAQKLWPNIVLLDLVMLRVSGLESLRWSRYRDPRSRSLS
jgi:DNA-binding NarL/FixJ family response regulator